VLDRGAVELRDSEGAGRERWLLNDCHLLRLCSVGQRGRRLERERERCLTSQPFTKINSDCDR